MTIELPTCGGRLIYLSQWARGFSMESSAEPVNDEPVNLERVQELETLRCTVALQPAIKYLS